MFVVLQIENVLAEEKTVGKDRLKLQSQKLTKLGLTPPKRNRLPMKEFLAAERNKKKREERLKATTPYQGVVLPSLNDGAKKQKFKDKRRDKGLQINTGKFKNGMLTLSKNEIKSIQGEGKKRRKM